MFERRHRRAQIAMLVAAALTAGSAQAATDWELLTGLRNDVPQAAAGAQPAPDNRPEWTWEIFVPGDVRTAEGNQRLVLDAISRSADTPLAFYTLLFSASAFGGAGDEVLVASALATLEQLTPQGVAGDPLAQAFVSDVLGLSGSSAGTLEVSAGAFFSTLTLNTLNISSQQLNFIASGGAVFYGLPFDNAGSFDVLVDGFVLDASLQNAVTIMSIPGSATLAGFMQSSSMTGACATGCTLANGASTAAFAASDDNATYGVSWGLLIPPVDFAAGTPLDENGPMNFIAANELTPRDGLPTSGIATYDTVIGGIGAVRATPGEASTGTLDAFSATVDFATAQVTSVAMSGQFNAGETFSATHAGGPSDIQADGSFATPLAGTCSFCSGALSGQMAGGFVEGGAALLAAYGLRAAAPGGTESIVGSVLATE